MNNKTIARSLRLLSQLMELHQENAFKVKSMATAAYTIDKLPFQVSAKELSELESIRGVGKSTAARVWELLQTGHLQELESLLEQTPPGIVEIMSVKGLGPKKVLVIWKELEIENLGELLYACNENRLIEAKGFGLKTQEEIKKAIEFKMASQGRFLYAHIEEKAEALISQLRQIFPSVQVSAVGAYRRRCEIVDLLEILVGGVPDAETRPALNGLEGMIMLESAEDSLSFEAENGLRSVIYFCTPENFVQQLLVRTGTEDHVRLVSRRMPESVLPVTSETDWYNRAGLPFIEPELREGLFELKLADEQRLPALLRFEDLKGSLHNHSTWSDGMNTIEEMALFCRDQLGLQYLGITDHSKTAYYARGLNEERILSQHQEIEELKKRLAPFRIFKGIESDILFDGSLDYSESVLASFDFIVASVHSVFRMTEEKATSRIIAAIENPYTTILGHPSGRMLLTRNGYPLDYTKIIDACAANGVVIEINSNPLRLDLDWRHHQYALEKGVMLSVNPDAHSVNGLSDMRYGVLAARKGGVPADKCLNTFSADALSTFFQLKKK